MIDLPQVSPAAARSWRRLAPRLPLLFALDGADWLLGRLETVVPEDWLGFEGRVEQHRVTLRVDPAALPAAAVARLPELEALGVPEGLKSILIEILLGTMGEAVTAWCGSGTEVLPSAAGLLPAERLNCLAVRRNGTAAAALAFDDDGFAWLAAKLLPLPPLVLALDDVLVSLDLLLDRVVLPARELREAAPGDVVLLDGASPADPDGALSVLVPIPGSGVGFRARIADSQLGIISTLNGQMDSTAPPLAASLDDLPLPVEFLVGKLTLPLSRLRELAPGQVFDLGLDVTTAVLLRVNGQVIAEGELVRIAERTGVRITGVHLARG